MRIDLGRFEAYVEERGDGEPLVLVHGLGGSTATWQKVAGPLAERFRVVVCDLRGLGQSGLPDAPWSLADLVGDLHGLLDHFALERVGLVGHSLGGAVVLACAAEHPERVTAAVALAAPSVTPPEQRPALADRADRARREGMVAVTGLHVAALAETYRDAQPAEAAEYAAIVEASDPEGYAALCDVIATLDLRAELGTIAAPVLLVAGELDPVVPPASVWATASLLASCDVVELEGCGHVIPFERPNELVKLVVGVLGAP
jgi:3-oxoadipate enol-lactonase